MARDHYETLQQVFDDAYRGLAAQNFQKSFDDLNQCAYRGDNGLKCAIGHCIPESLYSSKIEGAVPDICGVEERYAEANILFDRLFAKEIKRIDLTLLQETHDASKDEESMKFKLLSFAVDHRLTVPDISSAA